MGATHSSGSSSCDPKKNSLSGSWGTATSPLAVARNKSASAPNSATTTPRNGDRSGRRTTRARINETASDTSASEHQYYYSSGVGYSGGDLVTTMAGSQVLTNFQKKMLIQTWSHVHRAGSGGIGKVAFQRFLAKRPKCRVLFQKASAVQVFGPQAGGQGSGDLADHYKMLTDLLDETVDNLQNLDEVGETCVAYGLRHSHMARHGFDKELWDVFGQMLLESITQLDTVRKHRELMKAWTILISFLIDKLRQGYEMGVRRPSLMCRGNEEDGKETEGVDGTSPDQFYDRPGN